MQLQVFKNCDVHKDLLNFFSSCFFKERDPTEGPVPRLDTCLCMLLSVTTLAIFSIIEEEEIALSKEVECSATSLRTEKYVSGKRRRDLVSSLQQLGDYEDLLPPPLPLISVANQAAAKAMMFLSGLTVGNGGYLDGLSLNDMPVNYCKYQLSFSHQLG